jgi:predicted DCC family thiol-disulfide oxidoreductase YuxK
MNVTDSSIFIPPADGNSPKSRKDIGHIIFYDSTCSLCQRGERLLGNMMRRRGFRIEPLSSPLGHLAARDGVDEMKVLTANGRIFGGAEAIAYLSRFVWWAQPIAWLWRLRAARPPLRWLYRRIAANRHCVDRLCRLPRRQPKWDFDRWF